MFSDNLATALLLYLEKHSLTYETASELCDLSPRYLGDIARKQTSPSLKTLEKICNGLHLSPTELLENTDVSELRAYRTPMQVSCCRLEQALHGYSRFSVCPRCADTLERDYQCFCSSCGQMLDWTQYNQATQLITLHKQDKDK